jgi:nucleotide-binding universal stress UspA family protein
MGQHVLVPVDRSSQSEKAYEYVLEELDEPRITLLHVINPASVFAYGDEFEFDAEGFRREERRRREDAERMLDEFEERASARGVEAGTIIRTGRPARRILETVEERDVDHVVMGSHGRSGVGRVLFGSVAESVTRRSPVPVTVVR